MNETVEQIHMRIISNKMDEIMELNQALATASQERTAYRISLEKLEASQNKVRTDAVVDFCEWLLESIRWDVRVQGKEYANKLEAGE